MRRRDKLDKIAAKNKQILKESVPANKGVWVIEEESNRKHDEVDAAMAKLGIGLTITGTATHAVRVDDQLRVFRGSYEEAEMAAQKLSTVLNDKTIKVVDLQQSF
jgi:hypothetical protein